MMRDTRNLFWGGVLAAILSASATAADDADITAAIAELEASVATLEQRIERLKDADAIERVHSLYGYYLDKALWDELVELFAEDATVEIAQRGVYVGKKRLREALELFGPQFLRHGYLHNHIQLQPVIHVAPDGRTAKMRARALSQLGTHGESALWSDGVYENEFIKENGVWKISKDHVYSTFFAHYDGGWAKRPRATPGISETIPPDLPPSEVYQSYPEIYVPPYHYPNPVTGQK